MVTTEFSSGSNGLNSLNDYLASVLTPPPSIEDIIAKVEAHELFTQDLRQRMEEDWSLVTLTEFDAGDGYQSYTSNEPLTYFQKIVSLLAGARLKIRVPVEKALREERQRQDAKERFLIGILAANDERLRQLGQPGLLDQLVSLVCLRGWFCGRALLVKDTGSGDTYADITPWDPMHISWAVGKRGLSWLCYKSKKTSQEIKEEYGMDLGGDSSLASLGDGVDVYDWYDGVYNGVIVDGKWAKTPTPHGSPRIPVFFGPVGHLPLIQSSFQGSLSKRGNLVHHGESIFEANRRLYGRMNLVMSTVLELVALSRNQAFTITSRDGSKTLKENPFLEGAQTPLAEGERIDLLPLMKMGQDTQAFLSLVSGEVQRGALPYTVYGQLAFQLSGYAVNLLKQATDAPIVPRKQAVETAYRQICSLIADQYATGSYDTMTLSGRGNNREWFEEEFTPEVVRGVALPEITLVVSTIQDDLQKMQIAIQARQPINGLPTLPDRWIWDNVLEVQDTDSMAEARKEQMGEQMLPAASLYEVGKAMWDRGRQDLALIYLRAAAMADITGALGSVLGGPGGPGGGQAAAGGFRPEVLPPQAQGIPSPQPTPQAGPLSPPGQARPGA